MTAYFSSETMKARKKWPNSFQVPKEKNPQFRIQYLVKISFSNNGDIKIFSMKPRIKSVISDIGKQSTTKQNSKKKKSKKK